jgi:hypothetical protein
MARRPAILYYFLYQVIPKNSEASTTEGGKWFLDHVPSSFNLQDCFVVSFYLNFLTIKSDHMLLFKNKIHFLRALAAAFTW